MQTKIMSLVNQICNMQSTDCRSLNKGKIAREIMNFANIPENAKIQEIPLDWNNQVVIMFLIPNSTNYYSLFAGIGLDNQFHFDLSISGILKNHEFYFFEEEKQIDIDYFK